MVFFLHFLSADKPGVCPAVQPGSVGACAELCSKDSDCEGYTKCCSNGCGRSCIAPGQ